ncbi:MULTISPECIES: helix-turn-helix domain-containing protein [Bhargavaea]|uniref:Helix-turn-helix domain-containing protein n=1 Tax=Bhargavaea changchunensis TaxID=2134037 RepID=A0ABW2NJT4_9BACL|nr:helix-turn-helix domain-containing protein [Bhargavaea sp. CC-171006]
MSFDDILLNIISRLDGERYKHAAFHLMKGKRSGQTLQDTEYYRLHPFFGMLPSLHSNDFDLAYRRLLSSGLIAEEEDKTVFLTTAGKTRAASIGPVRLNGWVYRGMEQLFFARLALTVQTVSHLSAGDRTFMPVTTDPVVQREVRHLFATILRGRTPEDIALEVRNGLEATGLGDDRLSRFVSRLTGKGMSGLTWRQLSELTSMPEMDLKVEWVETLHIWLDGIAERPTPLLSALSQGVRAESPLTGSAKKTEELYRAGLSMEEISQQRNLKMSTIEDHFVEIAINDQKFPLHKFTETENVEAVRNEAGRLATRKLSVLKRSFPGLSYFQLRLILARLGKEDGDDGHDNAGKSEQPAQTGHRI